MIDFTKIKSKKEVGKFFDYAILPKQTQEQTIRDCCKEAIKYNCKAFCFSSSYWTPVVAEELAGTDLLVGAAIGFPFGQQTSAVKAFETAEAVRMGATVLDNCMNVGALKDKKYDEIKQEFKEYVDAAQGVMTKMIIEVCYLTDDEIRRACDLIIEAGIDWVKSSSGQYGGPTTAQVMLMAECTKGTKTKVKVSGVKDPRPQNAYMFLRAGAELIGTRQAPTIIDEFDNMRKAGIIPPYEGD